MTRLTVGAALLIVTGVTLGSIAPARSAWRPRVDRGEWIFTADLHVHVFPGDGALPPWEIVREAGRRGIDVVALTAHNQTFPIHLARVWPADGDALAVSGDEVTTPGFHMAAVGVTSPVDWRLSVEDAAAAVHRQGGVAIAAHPLDQLRAAFTDDAVRAIDGVEATHGWGKHGGVLILHPALTWQHAVRVSPAISPVSSTDFHTIAPIGAGRTFVFAPAITESALLDALRHGRTVACSPNGRTTGTESLAVRVRADCEAAAIERAHRPLASRVSNVLVWFGLLVLVLFAFA